MVAGVGVGTGAAAFAGTLFAAFPFKPSMSAAAITGASDFLDLASCCALAPPPPPLLLLLLLLLLLAAATAAAAATGP